MPLEGQTLCRALHALEEPLSPPSLHAFSFHHQASKESSLHLLVPVLIVPLPHPHSFTIYRLTFCPCYLLYGLLCHYHFWAFGCQTTYWGPLRSDPCCSPWHSGPLVPFLDSVSLVSGTLISPLCLPDTLFSGSIMLVGHWLHCQLAALDCSSKKTVVWPSLQVCQRPSSLWVWVAGCLQSASVRSPAVCQLRRTSYLVGVGPHHAFS